MTSKKLLGQFYTTNVEHILQRLSRPTGYKCIEPFVGKGDLLKWCPINETYDIEPKCDCIQRDTLLNPPDYINKFIITNPPYLAKNKTNLYKDLFKFHDTNDLYKIFLKTIVNGNVAGGILILPLNFMCSMDYKIRDYFFGKYHITKLNIFETRVFEDTDIPICSFEFYKGKQTNDIDAMFFPSKKNIMVSICKKNKWLIGGEIYNPVESKYKLGRLLKNQTATTNLYLKTTDTGTEAGRIKMVVKEPYYGKITDRNVMTITSNIPIENESHVADEFNLLLNKHREKYNSLFLTNFRNSTTYTRKRISFSLVFLLLKKVLNKLLTP